VERAQLSLVSTIEKLLEREGRDFSLENRDYTVGNPTTSTSHNHMGHSFNFTYIYIYREREREIFQTSNFNFITKSESNKTCKDTK
jgi:hypothetical protein